MLWSSLRAIVNSKAYWSLNILFFVVPLLSRLRVSIDQELFGLYVAAWFLLVGGLLYAVTRPDLLRFEDFASLSSAGRDTRYLQRIFEGAGGKIDDIADKDIRGRLKNEGGNQTPNASVFWHVFQLIDSTKKGWRFTISACMLVAALLLLTVNVSRFVRVAIATFKPQEFTMATAKLQLPIGIHMSVGSPVEVTHEDGSGGTQKTSGELIDSDDNGYVVIKTGSGKLIYIPKGKVITVVRDV